MKNHSPAFQLYPKEFLSDVNVVDMTDKECGRYIKLLCHCWIEDGLSKDLRVVKGWLNHSPSIARCFYEKDGKFHHKRLDEEREKQRIWAEKSRIGGLHSIEKKRLVKGGYKGGSRVVQPKANSSSSSSSSILKNKYKNTSSSISFDVSSRRWNGIEGTDMEAWANSYPACDINMELGRMGEWIIANPAKGKKSNYRRFIVNWLSRSQDRGGSVPSRKPEHRPDAGLMSREDMNALIQRRRERQRAAETTTEE